MYICILPLSNINDCHLDPLNLFEQLNHGQHHIQIEMMTYENENGLSSIESNRQQWAWQFDGDETTCKDDQRLSIVENNASNGIFCTSC